MKPRPRWGIIIALILLLTVVAGFVIVWYGSPRLVERYAGPVPAKPGPGDCADLRANYNQLATGNTNDYGDAYLVLNTDRLSLDAQENPLRTNVVHAIGHGASRRWNSQSPERPETFIALANWFDHWHIAVWTPGDEKHLPLVWYGDRYGQTPEGVYSRRCGESQTPDTIVVVAITNGLYSTNRTAVLPAP